MKRSKQAPEAPTLRKEYIVLFLIIVFSSWALLSWCGPGIREALRGKVRNKTKQTTKTSLPQPKTEATQRTSKKARESQKK